MTPATRCPPGPGTRPHRAPRAVGRHPNGVRTAHSDCHGRSSATVGQRPSSAAPPCPSAGDEPTVGTARAPPRLAVGYHRRMSRYGHRSGESPVRGGRLFIRLSLPAPGSLMAVVSPESRARAEPPPAWRDNVEAALPSCCFIACSPASAPPPPLAQRHCRALTQATTRPRASIPGTGSISPPLRPKLGREPWDNEKGGPAKSGGTSSAHFAYSIARVSRTTVTRICPG